MSRDEPQRTVDAQTSLRINQNERPVAIVTGAAHRLGRHIAAALATHGWNVALHYRSSETQALQTLAELSGIGGQHHVIRADLADEADCRQLFDSAVQTLGRVDAVINNAALFEYDDAASFDTENLLAHMLPNLAAPVILAQELRRHLLAGDSDRTGVVINLLDQKLDHPNPDFLSYTLSKSALKTATTLLAKALAPRIRVAGVSPGLTLPSHMQTDEAFQKTHRLAPLGRSSQPEDIARAVLFILNSPSITGIDLPVDGGQHLVGMERDFSLMAP